MARAKAPTQRTLSLVDPLPASAPAQPALSPMEKWRAGAPAKRTLILAEKPAVARDIARVLGLPGGGGAAGCFQGDRYVVTWCIGHLIELEEPAAYQPNWKRWSFASLPMLPESFMLRPVKTTLKQWRVVRDLLRSRDFGAVVNACDAGREGELIFRLCYELAGSKLPIMRLWISSLTDQAISQGMAQLRPGRDYDPLADAARCRSEADWLVGMNATRAVTLKRREHQDVLCSIGRVQTPTLGLIVHRERQILSFVPRDYWEIHAHLFVPAAPGSPEAGAGKGPAGFRALWTYQQARRLGHEALAQEVAGRSTESARRQQGPIVESVDAKTVREPPPLLFDLTSLQRTANRKMGLSAHRTLQVAQALYEKHKLISYPRTDSRYLTSDLLPELPRLFSAIGQEPTYARFSAPLLAQPPAPPRRVFRDDQARDHHAIIPTAVGLTPAKLGGLDREERHLLDLIIRRFLGAFYPDAEFKQTRVVVRVGLEISPKRPVGESGDEKKPPNKKDESRKDEILEAAPPPPDRYEAGGRVRLRAGWQEVAGFGAPAAGRGEPADADRNDKDEEESQELPDLRVGQLLGGSFHPERRQTRPPARYTEATLLSAMEYAGQHLLDEELRQRMKDVGLGTPATRASIIETLILRTYIERRGKQLHPTSLGMDLVEHLPVPDLASPELTGRWEARLARIARGEDARSAFMKDIENYVTEIVSTVQKAPAPAAVALSAGAPVRPGQRPRRTPRSAPGQNATPARTRGTKTRRTRAPGVATLTKNTIRAGTRKKATTKSGSSHTPATGPTASRPIPTEPYGSRPTQEDRGSRAKPEAHASRPKQEDYGSRPTPEDYASRPPPQDQAPRLTPGVYPSRSAPAGGASSRSGSVGVGPSRSGLAADVGAVGAEVAPALTCPRCRQGKIIVGKRGWGCSRWQASCPFVVPFEVLGRKLGTGDLRALIEKGASSAMEFKNSGSPGVLFRLRLAPKGSPAGFVYLEPV